MPDKDHQSELALVEVNEDATATAAAAVKAPADGSRLEDLLAFLMIDEERGGIPELRMGIQLCAPIFAASPYTALVSCYERIKKQVLPLIAYEEKYGRRSLLKRGHPFNDAST